MLGTLALVRTPKIIHLGYTIRLTIGKEQNVNTTSPPSKTSTSSLWTARLASLVIIGGLFIGWNSIWIYPFQMLTVFFHELSHAIAALLTGGEVLEFFLDPRQGGHVIHRGGNLIITATAGYLGSLAWGVALFWTAHLSRFDKVINGLLALIILVVPWLLKGQGFALVFCSIFGICLLLTSIKASHWVNDFLLRLIGLSCVLYVPGDIYSDTIARSGTVVSDATNIAELLGGSTMMWGIIWLVISLVILLIMFIQLWKSPGAN